MESIVAAAAQAAYVLMDREATAGPVAREETILFAEIDVNKGRTGRRKFDPVGHYNRPDVFRLSIDVGERRAVHTFDGNEESRGKPENV